MGSEGREEEDKAKKDWVPNPNTQFGLGKKQEGNAFEVFFSTYFFPFLIPKKKEKKSEKKKAPPLVNNQLFFS